MKFANPASRYALVGVFVAKTAGGVRVAVTGAGENGVFRASAMRSRAECEFPAAALEGDRRPGEWPQFRYPCRRRLSRAPDQRDGEARGRSGGLKNATLAPMGLPGRLPPGLSACCRERRRTKTERSVFLVIP